MSDNSSTANTPDEAGPEKKPEDTDLRGRYAARPKAFRKHFMPHFDF